MSYSKKNAYKIIAASICTIILIIVMVCTSIKPTKLLGSVYNINDLEKNASKIKVGDSINYEINGYSKWKVIYVDKENNTVDVVSKDNLGEMTLSTKEDFDTALDTLQEMANRYVDNKYAIKARSVTRADLDYFGFDTDFWTADNFDGAISFSGGKIRYIDPDLQSENYYMLPFIEYYVGSNHGYNRGDEYDLNLNGVSKWFVVATNWESIILIPKDPVKINLKNNDQILDCPDCYFNDYINNFYQEGYPVWNAGHLFNMCFDGCCEVDCINSNETIRNYYISKNMDYRVFRGGYGVNTYVGVKSLWMDLSKFRLDTKSFECCYGDNYQVYQPVTKGFRPVVTLKFSNNISGKDESTNVLSVGDNVKYNALEYQNWKVLSIDKKNNTAELISGGVVKNLYLQGQEDFDNYEDILQREVDKYKSGSNVISARPVEYADLANLNKINDKVNAKYWINAKRQFNKKVTDETSSPYTGEAYFNVGIMYFDTQNMSIEKKWVPLYAAPGANNNNAFVLSAYNGFGELSFTAGIRPIITVKLSDIQKIDEETKKDIINNETNNEKNISKEQETNNYYYVIDYDSSDDNKIDNKSSDVDNKKGTINNYYGDEDNGEGDKLVKYVLIGLIILNVSIIAQVVLSAIIFKKIKK